MGRVLKVALAVALVAAAPAGASSVAIEEVDVGDRFDVEIQEELHVDGLGAERNRIVVRALRGGRYEVRDRGARLRAHDECRERSRHRAVCEPRDAIAFVDVALRAGDDRLLLRGTDAFVSAGRGDDRVSGGGSVEGGAGADVLRGRASGDRLDGGPGRDRLIGGAGNDTLRGADARDRPEGDRLLGGPGRDTASWNGRTAVRARLDGGRVRAGPDRGTGIEVLRGSSRSDRLTGGDGDDWLFGGDGDDMLDGRGGDDRLYGGYRRNRDVARCGAGDDQVRGPRLYVLVAADCERAGTGGATVVPRLTLVAPDRLEAPLGCPSFMCFTTLRLVSAPRGSTRARALAPALAVGTDAAHTAATFALSPFGQAHLARAGAVACVADPHHGFCAQVQR